MESQNAKIQVVAHVTNYTFQPPPKKIFVINSNLSYNPKNIVYIIQYTNCNQIYIGCTQTLDSQTSLHKTNIKLLDNGKLCAFKHLYECNKGNSKIIPIYQINDYSLLLIKEKTL